MRLPLLTMSTYAVIQDYVDRFGLEEAIQLTDRTTIQTNAINAVLLQAKMDDAEAELNVVLNCCYSVKAIQDIYTGGGDIPVLRHWVCDITRKHLYDLLENSDHQVIREYKDFKEEIMEICKCQGLIDDQFEEVPKKGSINNYLLDEPGCYPKICCCTGTCCCGSSLDTL